VSRIHPNAILRHAEMVDRFGGLTRTIESTVPRTVDNPIGGAANWALRRVILEDNYVDH